MLFSDFIVWYLFLGGLGAGVAVVAFVIQFIIQSKHGDRFEDLGTLIPTMFLISTGSLVLGLLCLVGDLTQPQNVSSLFVSPSFSIISIGALALTALTVCVAVLSMLELSDTIRIRATATRAIGAFTCVLALAVALYTGIFLCQMSAIPFWHSALIPVLFVLSAMSTGLGSLFLVAVFAPHQCPNPSSALRPFFVIDAVIVCLELLATVLFFFFVGDDPVAHLSGMLLLSGEYAPRFIIGFIICGIVIPLAIELGMLFSRSVPNCAIGFSGGCILIGGFFLRSCIIAGGIHVSTLMFAGM